MMKKLAGILAGLCLSVLAFGQLDITKRNVTVTQNFHVRSDTVLNAGEVAEMINDSVDLAAKQDTGLSLLKSDTITKIPTVTQLSDSLDSWNTSLAKQITADDTTWWGQSTDTTNISLRIDSCLKVADSTDYITTHAYQTDTAGASNTGTVPAYRYNYWNAKQAALTNPVTGTGISNRLAYWNAANEITYNNNGYFDGSSIRIRSISQYHSVAYPLQVVSTSAANMLNVNTAANGATSGAIITLMQHNGSSVTSGTRLGSIHFVGAYSSDITQGRTPVMLQAFAESTFSSSYSGYFRILTATGSTLYEALRVTSTQNLQLGLGKMLQFQATIGSNTTNDKKWSADANYRAIFQNYSGGDYGDSVSIANNGDIYTPGLIRIGSTNADSIAATRGYVKDAINDSLLNAGQIVTKNTGNTVAITGTSTSTYGIFGNSTSGFGIYGLSASNQGVRGTSSTGYGVAGTSSSNIGVYAHSTSGAGIYGSSASHYGGYFETATNLKIVSFSKSGTNAGEKAYIDTNGYFSGGIKADANDTIFFGSDYLTGTGSGMITVGGGARIYSEGSLELDDEITTPEVVTDQISLNYTGSPQIAMTIGDHLGQLTINEASNFSNVEIKADSIELTGNITTTGTINGIKFLFVSDTLSSASILAGTVKKIIAAPGSGKYIKIISADLFYKHGGTDYVGAYTPIIDYVSSLDGKYYVPTFTIESATSAHNNLFDIALSSSNEGTSYTVDNKGLYLGVNGTPTTGNGYLKIDILYTINDY